MAFSKEDLRAHTEWEGGLIESIFGYGLGYEDLPKDAPVEVCEAWKKLEAARDDADVIESWLYNEED